MTRPEISEGQFPAVFCLFSAVGILALIIAWAVPAGLEALTNSPTEHQSPE